MKGSVTLVCGECSESVTIADAARFTADELAVEFALLGWSVQPVRCPAHNTSKAET